MGRAAVTSQGWKLPSREAPLDVKNAVNIFYYRAIPFATILSLRDFLPRGQPFKELITQEPVKQPSGD
jgi:hypothetical protein